jgi:toxin ParE1/3/4
VTRALRFSPEARADLQAMGSYFRREAGPRAAARYLRDVSQRLARLRQSPKTGVALPEYGDSVRFVPCRRHVIYYELDSRGVIVLRILHASQDRESIMSRRKKK